MNTAPTHLDARPAADQARARDRLDAVWQLLEPLTDPEIPVVSLREMGILREVRFTDQGAVEVVITPTYSGCPAMAQIEADVRGTLERAGVAAQVRVQLSPAWTTDWMDGTARDKLRAWGVAPPAGCAVAESRDGSGGGDERLLRFAPVRDRRALVACPRCGSENTTEVSHFGSTACKALYRCLDCLEPFDYFKPH